MDALIPFMPWIWVAIIVITIIWELSTFDLNCLWFTIAATAALVISFFPDVFSPVIQLVVFAFMSLVLFLSSCNLLNFKTNEPTEKTENPTIQITPTPTLYNIVFISELGTTPDMVTNLDKIPSDLPVLEYEGFQFDGWYYDREYTKKAFK